MFIIPYTHDKRNGPNNTIINTIMILTIGGTQLWDEYTVPAKNIDKDILIPNGLIKTSKSITPLNGAKEKTYLCEIDASKTNMGDFYNWSEISLSDTETFCWRKFNIIMGEDGNSWLPVPDFEKIGDYKVHDIVSGILKM
jgi:hypothetical protein